MKLFPVTVSDPKPPNFQHFKAITADMHVCTGSMQAAVHLMQKLNTVVLQCIVVIELVSLNGRSQVPADVFALILQ